AAVRLAGRRRLALPYSLHRRLARLTCDGQPDGVAYLRHAVTIDGAAWRVRAEIRAAGDHSAPPTSAASARALAPGAGAVDAAALPRFDDYDLDPAYVARLDRLFLRAMHDRWWRIEVRGLEHVPRDGRGVLTGVHRGFQPWDGVMMLRLCAERLMRHPRFLVHPSLVKMPWLAPYMRKLGGIIACRENAARVLEADDLLAIFPEGISGAFRPYRDAYRLTRFGRDEYLKMALRHRAPIVPFVTVGSAEIFPIVAKVQWRWWTRTMEWPCLPIAPPFPLLPVPLPSKWHTVFLPPIHVERRYGPDAADDAALVRALSRRIQMRMQAALDDLRARRPGIFRGRIWADPEAPTLSPAVLASTPVLERDAEAA
ncbi:MAG: lysophospholipid acyltransferase family protein, partial [Acidobacteriota bacterium]